MIVAGSLMLPTFNRLSVRCCARISKKEDCHIKKIINRTCRYMVSIRHKKGEVC
jgi:hypothetical protein